ncbi:MAG: hypothetical protein J7M38_10680 [Armatimonadetes bacterium]|nr:hypothetical protein [Armatimonadota bacterium]
MRMTLLPFLVLLTATLVLSGCPKPQPAQQEEVPPPENIEAGADQPAETASVNSDFEWTATPSLDMIPDGPVVGMINGKPFAAQTVRLKQDDEQTVLEISDVAVDEPTGLTMDDTGVDLRFTLEPGKPGEFVVGIEDDKDFDKEHAYYHYPLPDDGGPMSINPSWGCALQITDWNLEGDENDEDILGRASGKVAITFDDEAKSWVAGTFDCIYYKW